jgi:transposase InsO family protein
MSRRTAWKLCSQAGLLSSAQRRRRGKGKKAGPPVFDDHVQRVFRADAPNRLWLTDITEHWTSEGKLYCCAIKDVFSNRIVGYSISDRMTAKLAVDAVRNAVARRGEVAGCILHADRGSQFRSRAMARELRRHDMVGSMGRVGAAGDNAAMEMLLSVSRGRGSALEESEQVAGVVPLEASHRFPLGLPIADSSGEIGAGFGVDFRAGEDCCVKRSIELAVTAA